MGNPYCEALAIGVPALEAVRDHPEASPYSLLIVALLECGEPMTLPEVAGRFARAGVAPADLALRSLKRCRPARAPVYRDGDLYALDPHDDDLDLWAFRLGLRPPKAAPLPVEATVRAEPAPLPAPEVPLTVAANRAFVRRRGQTGRQVPFGNPLIQCVCGEYVVAV